MKKLKMVIYLIVLIFGLSYLSSCISKEDKPKIYMFSPEIDFSSIKFDIKVVEPEEILIKEVYINLYNGAELVETLSSEDGIHKIGVTEDIMFYALASKTKYKIDFYLDYLAGENNEKNVLAYSYNFITAENNTGVYGHIFNLFIEESRVKFDAMFNDVNKIVTDLKIYLKQDHQIIDSLSMEDGLHLGKNYGCEFGPFPSNSHYEILLCATFVYKNSLNEKIYEDLPLAKNEFNTGSYTYLPTASISNVILTNDVVTFDLTLIDEFDMLINLSLVLLDLKDNVISELLWKEDLVLGKNENCIFEHLYPNSLYTLSVIATYKTPLALFKNETLTSYFIITDSFDIEPTAMITNVKTNDDVVNFDYSIIDKYNKIRDCSIVLYDSSNTIVKKTPIEVDMALENNQGTFNLLMPNSDYRIAIEANIDQKDEIVQITLAAVSVETGDYPFAPTATIIDMIVSEDVISFDYNILDSYSLLTALQCNILNIDNELIQTIDLTDKMSNSYHNVIINNLNKMKHLKIHFLADYLCCGYENENEIIGSFDYIENSKEDFEYIEINQKIEIIKYVGNSKTCIIPKIIENKEVAQIGRDAFKDKDIHNIIIPDSVTLLSYSAFENCNNLINIVIPKSVKSMWWNLFYSTSNLTNVFYEGTIEDWCNISFGGSSANPMNYASHFYIRNSNNEWEEVTSIKIPDGVTTIGSYQFLGFRNVTSLSIPESVTSIGGYAFNNCSNLTSVIIPDSVLSIGNSAFASCSSLVSLTLPESVTSIGDSAFASCSSLTSVIIPDSVLSIGNSAFASCSSLVSLTLPESVTSIGDAVFANCSSLVSLTLPESVTSIEDYAFYNCSSLTSVIIPDSMLSIGNSAFERCFNLTNIYYEGTIEDWCNISFDGKTANPMNYASHFYIRNSNNEWEEVTSIKIPDGVTTIGPYQFLGFRNVTSLSIPESVISIGDSAFASCSSLTSLTLPESVTSIGDSAFENCISLVSLTLPKSVTSIGASAFKNCSSLTSLTLPEGVTSIGSSTFANCKRLISLTLPKSVTSIGALAFENCISLVSLTLPESVISIGDSAFKSCSSLTSLTISKSVTSIGNLAFERCLDLTNIYYEGTIEDWNKILFDGSSANPMNYARHFYIRNSNNDWVEMYL